MQLFSALELTFSIDLSAEEGGGNVELLPNGRDLEVTAANVYSYVRKYSHYRWVKYLAVQRLAQSGVMKIKACHNVVLVLAKLSILVQYIHTGTVQLPVGQALDMK